MQFKPITAIIVLLLVVASLLVVGCTSSSNTTSSSNSPTPSLAGNALAADNLASAINDRYNSLGYTVNTPFTMSKNNSTISYSGVITDGQNVLTPFKRTVTIILLPIDRAAAFSALNNSIGTAKAQGYQEFGSSNATVVYWAGYLGTKFSSDPSVPRVNINLNQPVRSPLFLDGDRNKEVMYNVDVGDYYQLIIDYQTAAGT